MAIRPVNVMFVITSMPVGGAETLLVNLVRCMDRAQFNPSICCLKEPGELGEQLSREFQVHSGLIRGKYDIGVLTRLRRLYLKNQIDAVITVGAGDKMFWGRLAARFANVPVVLSALHSTGWPDGVGRLNRLLTPITDGFIAVAKQHGRHLAEVEKFPASKVFVIPNGIDTDRFVRNADSRTQWRSERGISADAPVVGIVAALRPEKNHSRFLRIARRVANQIPDAQFVIAGDGPERTKIEQQIEELSMNSNVHLLGTVSDIPAVLSMLDLFALTSDNEASPVSIIEAMSCELPVVAPRVGSISELVINDVTGIVVGADDESEATTAWLRILENRSIGTQWGRSARDRAVASASLTAMTGGYCTLIHEILAKKNFTSTAPFPQFRNTVLATGKSSSN